MRVPQKKTKIIATVGPASRSKEMLIKLYQAGANIFRLNFSHGTHEDHKKTIDWVREINAEFGADISLLQDLQGPKIRVNQVKDGGVPIKEGDKIEIEAGDFEGDASRISTTYKTIAKDVVAGDQILIDDGNLELKVISTDGKTVKAEVVFGGTLKSRKGINLPSTKISEPCLTEKDLKDLQFGLEQEVDWIALSFVREAADLLALRKLIDKSGKKCKMIAKVEKPEAIKNMDEVVAATDAVMVARGDLGVEIDAAKVPMIQKELIRKCNEAGKPVIVATQMLESMTTNPRPTRAETNDVANAILDGTDVVMLSAESASGDFPEQAVLSMTRIIQEIEATPHIYEKFDKIDETSRTKVNDSLLYSACRLAEFTEAKALVGMTGSGYTAYQMAKHRPKSQIFIFSADPKLVTQLSLIWGVRAFAWDKAESMDDTVEDTKKFLVDKGYLKKGDVVVNTASSPVWRGGHTNTLKIGPVE